MDSSIPDGIDHAFIMVQDVEQALEACRNVPVATIYSNGFADAGREGMERQARLALRARELGVRLLGPNSMGVINLPGRMALSVNAVLEIDAPPSGTTSLVSQSGTMLSTVPSIVPLCETRLVVPEGGASISSTAFTLSAMRPGRLMTPMLFGPSRRTPSSLARRARRACRSMPSRPASAKPLL